MLVRAKYPGINKLHRIFILAFVMFFTLVYKSRDIDLNATSQTPSDAESGKTSKSVERISTIKCNEYKDLVKQTLYITAIFGSPPIEKTIIKCPFISVPLIVGGVKAIPKEFPHMALIGYGEKNDIHWHCGGSLISEQFVITAAHCLESRELGPATIIRLGELDLIATDDDAQPTDFNVMERIYHPEYKIPSYYNDIALIRLSISVTFNSYIRPICLPDSNDTEPPKNVIASGYGRVSWRGESSNDLLKVVLEMFNHQECFDTYRNAIGRRLKDGIINSQICAGSRVDQKDSCQGDSGGPLQKYHSNHACMYTILGLTSFGRSCGEVAVPSVYTKVESYLSWIEDIVWPST